MSKLINPPDLAIALHYDRKTVPRVTASGRGAVAEQIIEIAEKHGIPMQPDPELARLLSSIPPGEEIPRELYVAVAEVIAFAYLLSNRGATPP